jgi:flagellar hook-associated protein 1
VLIPSYIAQLDNVAANLVTEVNKLHAGDPTATPPVVAGNTMTKDALGNPVPGGYFFDPTKLSAGSISLAAGIVGHPELIAASKTGAAGDGDIATAISEIQSKLVSGGLTINQLYRTMIGDVGSTSAIAQSQAAAFKLSVDQFTTQAQSVSGVSLDEEMTNMIKFQQAYNASAKLLTTMNTMLDVLMNIGK